MRLGAADPMLTCPLALDRRTAPLCAPRCRPARARRGWQAVRAAASPRRVNARPPPRFWTAQAMALAHRPHRSVPLVPALFPARQSAGLGPHRGRPSTARWPRPRRSAAPASADASATTRAPPPARRARCVRSPPASPGSARSSTGGARSRPSPARRARLRPTRPASRHRRTRGSLPTPPASGVAAAARRRDRVDVACSRGVLESRTIERGLLAHVPGWQHLVQIHHARIGHRRLRSIRPSRPG